MSRPDGLALISFVSESMVHRKAMSRVSLQALSERSGEAHPDRALKVNLRPWRLQCRLCLEASQRPEDAGYTVGSDSSHSFLPRPCEIRHTCAKGHVSVHVSDRGASGKSP